MEILKRDFLERYQKEVRDKRNYSLAPKRAIDKDRQKLIEAAQKLTGERVLPKGVIREIDKKVARDANKPHYWVKK